MYEDRTALYTLRLYNGEKVHLLQKLPLMSVRLRRMKTLKNPLDDDTASAFLSV